MPTAHVRFSEEQMAAVRAAAKRRGVSVSAYIRNAALATLPVEPKPVSDGVWERASKLVGAFRSGTGDMSARHDDIFVEAALNE